MLAVHLDGTFFCTRENISVLCTSPIPDFTSQMSPPLNAPHGVVTAA